MSLADGYKLAKEYWPGLSREEFDAYTDGFALLREEWDHYVEQDTGLPLHQRLAAFYAHSFGVALDLLALEDRHDEHHKLDVVEKLIRGAGSEVVLDYGGGIGWLAIHLARLGLTVAHFDLGETAALARWRFAREGLLHRVGHGEPRGKVHPFRCARDALARGQQWDAVIALDVLEHLSQPVAVAARIYTTLRPGGIFIATLERFKPHPSGHLEGNFWLQEGIQGELENIGFRQWRRGDPHYGISAWQR